MHLWVIITPLLILEKDELPLPNQFLILSKRWVHLWIFSPPASILKPSTSIRKHAITSSDFISYFLIL
jgi:hypothetical protein